jgi:predicted nucleic acid-binding protein
MIYLADTSFSLRLAIKQNPQHQIIRQAGRTLKNRGDEIYIVPQTCVEFWNVATRPVKNNGFGFPVADADFFSALD